MEIDTKKLESLIAQSFEAYKLNLLAQDGMDLRQLKANLKQLTMPFDHYCLLCFVHHSYFCSYDFTAKSWGKSKSFIVKQLDRFYDRIYPNIRSNELFQKMNNRRLAMCSKSGRCENDYGLSSVASIALTSDLNHSDLIDLARLRELTQEEIQSLLFLNLYDTASSGS